MSVASMDLVKWHSSYLMHMPVVDHEHQDFFGFINRLHAAMLAGQGKDILERLLEELLQYTFYHFAHEEELMVAIKYPGLAAHAQGHNDLRRMVQTFVDRYQHGELAMTVELTLFLSAWLKEHILTTDRTLGEYLHIHKIISSNRTEQLARRKNVIRQAS